MITNDTVDADIRIARLEGQVQMLERSLEDRINLRVYQESNRLLLFLMPVILTMTIFTLVIARI